MAEWDAARYHRISTPQFDWGQRVIARLRPMPRERILDVGCGTGRLTQEISTAVADGLVVGADASGAMIAVARESLPPSGTHRPFYVQADGLALPFVGRFDAVFSAATLHWILDHAAVFASVHRALVPGGRFVAQCGGDGNLRRLLDRTASLMTRDEYREWFAGWTEPWFFADARSTAARLREAGFVDVETSVEDAPVDLPDEAAYAEFVSCVCIRHHLERLPLPLREPFVRDLAAQAAQDSPPCTLDYRRLNIAARRGAA